MLSHSFIRKYSHHAVDFRWDSYFYSEYGGFVVLDRADRNHTKQESTQLFEAPPALGAVSFRLSSKIMQKSLCLFVFGLYMGRDGQSATRH